MNTNIKKSPTGPDEPVGITLTGTYSYRVSGYDWGAGVNQAILALDHEINGIALDNIEVLETRQVTDWTNPAFPVVVTTTPRRVTAICPCDATGTKTDGPSNHFALQLAVGPTEGSPLVYDMAIQRNAWSNPYHLTFNLTKGAILVAAGKTVKSLEIAPTGTKTDGATTMFVPSRWTGETDISYEYVTFTPDDKSDVLVVWLHGVGEGGAPGSDSFMPVIGNKAAALAGTEFQSIVNQATILAPQCPTMWMDDGSGDYTRDGKSVYTKSLKEFITYFKNKIQAKKVVLAGCSNGGYMVLELMINYPDFFVAGVPICPAQLDAWISDKSIEILKNQPLFFIYSKDDPVVDPSSYEVPLIARLKAANATKLAVSTTEHVIDTSGRYHDAQGNPYRYNGHWSWIYFDNNEALEDDTGQDSWSWIRDQINS